MKNETKNYCRYFIKRHTKLILLISTLLFLTLPFLAFTKGGIRLFSYSSQETIDLMGFASTLSFCAFVLAAIIPNIVFKFLHKRNSCDLYFALPMNRKTLFSLQYILGLGMALIPLTLNVILVLVIILVRYAGLLGIDLLIYIMLVYILFFALYSIITLLIIKCNNTLDAILATIGVIFLPMILLLTLRIFLNMQVNAIYVSVNTSFQEVFDISILFRYISPITCSKYFASYLDSRVVLSLSEYILPLCYWFILGFVSLYFARKTFIQKKEEDVEQRTISLLIYPLMILIIMISLIIITFDMQMEMSDRITSTLVILVVYMISNFIWRRKIQFKIKELLMFGAIYGAVFGFTLAFQSTTGFGLLSEIPNQSEIDKVDILINSDNEYTSITYDEEEIDLFQYYVNKQIPIYEKELIKDIVNIQKSCIEIGNNMSTTVYSSESIEFTYHMMDGSIQNRYYSIYNEKGNRVMEEAVDILSVFYD